MYKIYKQFHSNQIGYNLVLLRDHLQIYKVIVSKQHVLDLKDYKIHELGRKILYQKLKELQ